MIIDESGADEFFTKHDHFMDNNIVLPPFETNPGRKFRSTSEAGFRLKNGTPALIHMIKFSLEIVEGAVVTNKIGKVYCINLLEPNSYGADAYWCDYDAHAVATSMIGPHAYYFFTPAMNGCSLMLGSLTREGYRLVSHANDPSPGGLAGLDAQKSMEKTEHDPRFKKIFKNKEKLNEYNTRKNESLADLMIKAQTENQRQMVRDQVGDYEAALESAAYRSGPEEFVTTYGLLKSDIRNRKPEWQIFTLRYKRNKQVYEHLGRRRQLSGCSFPLS